MGIDPSTASRDFYGDTIAGLRRKQVDCLRDATDHQKKATDLQKKATELEEVIKRLRGLSEGSGTEPDTRYVILGEYKGHKISLALTLYLRARRGQRIPIDRIVDDLFLAGVDPGKSRGNQTPAQALRQNLKITASSNPKRVQWDPKASVMWAADTIDEPPKPRLRKSALRRVPRNKAAKNVDATEASRVAEQGGDHL
jgi:hypothetical protein